MASAHLSGFLDFHFFPKYRFGESVVPGSEETQITYSIVFDDTMYFLAHILPFYGDFSVFTP